MPLSRFLSVTDEGLTQPSEQGGSGATGQEQKQHHGDVHQSTGPHRLWDHSTWKEKKPTTTHLPYHYCDSRDEPATAAGENYREHIL